MAVATTDGRLQIKVFSPYRVFFEGSAVSLSAVNKTGPFDILYNHSNFFSLLLPGVIRINTGFEMLEIEIDKGVLKASSNTVQLFANV